MPNLIGQDNLLGESWIDSVSRVLATLIPASAVIDLGTADQPFRNLYLSGAIISDGSQTITGNLQVTGNIGATGNVSAAGDFTAVGISEAANYTLSDGYALNYPVTVYGSGADYALTNTSAAINFGGQDPTLTISKAGTWLITAAANLKYNGATFAANRTVSLKLRRTNNTPADLADSGLTLTTGIVTTLTASFAAAQLPYVIYSTTNTNDVITIFGDVNTVPSAGSLDVIDASLVAIRIDA